MNGLKFFDQGSGVFEILPVQLPSEAGGHVPEDKGVSLQWSQHPAETRSTLPAYLVSSGDNYLSFELMAGAIAVAQDDLTGESS